MGTFLNVVARLGRSVYDAISGGFSRVFTFFKDLPGKLLGYIKDLPGKIVDLFRGLGPKMLGAIFGVVTNVAGVGRDFANGLIDLINKILPDKISIPGAPDINLPDNPIPKFAKGGRVGTGFGGGDRRVILAEDGEWVIRKDRVAALGESFMALINGGWGNTGPGFATGGPIRAYGVEQQQVLVNTDDDLKEQASNWRDMWQEIVATTRRSRLLVEDQYRTLRVNATASMRRLYNDMRDYIAAIQNSFEVRGQRIRSSWSKMFDSLKDTVFDGLKYIGTEVSKALKQLGGKPVNLGLSSPTRRSNAGQFSGADSVPGGGRFAGGGVVGQWGERGRDAVQTWLGRGEVVLNWGQQMAANAAMSGRSTLRDIVERTSGFHAGGVGAIGLASGGGDIFNGHPSNVNSAVLALIRLLQSKFPLLVTSTTDHSRLTTSGNVSDHTTGAAVDLAASPSIMLKAAAFIKTSGLYKKLKQGIHNPNLAVNNGELQEPPGQFAGAVWAQHANHLHLAITGALKGVFADATSEIRKVTVEGAGALKGIAQGALDAVRAAANKMISKAAAQDPGDEDYGPLKGSANGEKIFRFFKQAGFSDNQAAAWVGNFVQESGLNPAIIQPNGEGHGLAQWGGGRFAALQEFAASKNKPWQDLQTQLEYVMHELHGSESGAYGAIKSATTLDQAVNAIGSKYERYGIEGDRSGPAREALATYGGEFAKGGIVPGDNGRPVIITAHAQEWVLNKMQQSKLASMLGASVGAVRDALGFSGGPTSFQDGGVISAFGSRYRGRRVQAAAA
jgi:hypothetical protein